MYETEVNDRVESVSQLSPEIRAAFSVSRRGVTARTLLPWSEHCTECVWPTCYTSCDLYQAREDLQCRRFIDGMVRLACPESLNGYLLKIRFKQWGKLWAPGNLRLFSSARAERISARDYRIGGALRRLPVPRPLKRIATSRRYNFKRAIAARPGSLDRLPSSFLIECHNPHPEVVRLSLTVRPRNTERPTPFGRLIELEPGFTCVRIPLDDIRRRVDLRREFSVELVPNIFADGTTLYFGGVDFVHEAAPAQVAGTRVKCVVWDLDETIWRGILVEDGAERLALRPRIAKVLGELDRRGILQSVASKNDRDTALRTLDAFGLREYFLEPQISWGPKSEAVETIARRLNIGIDTLLFVDDSEFERNQVRARFPGLRTLPAADYLDLLAMPECAAGATEESAQRRQLYQIEERRRAAAADHGDDYLAFLRDCKIELGVGSLCAGNLDRVHELTQRTNQMNFSGNRYDKAALEQILSAPHLDAYVLDCGDRFGSYGVIGFCTVDWRRPRMTDLMFSCRIQSKRVEHAFVGFLARKYCRMNRGDFFADYRRTERNAPSGRVFDDLGFRQVGTVAGLSLLVLPAASVPRDDGIVALVAR